MKKLFIHNLIRSSHLKLAPLCVQGERVEEHGADEGDAGGLAVVDPLRGVNPQPSEFRENINGFECFQVVDENIGNPKAFYQLKVNLNKWFLVSNQVRCHW